MQKTDFDAIKGLIMQTIDVFRKSLRPLLISLLLLGVLGIITFLLMLFVASATAASPILGGLLMIIVCVAVTIGACLPIMMIIKITKNTLENRESDVEKLISESSEKIINVFTTSFICGLFSSLRSLLLVIPGIWKAVQWIFSVIVSTLTDKKNGEAMNYSKKLVEGRRRKTFSYYLVAGVAVGFVTLIVSLIFSIFPDNLAELLTNIVSITLSGATVVYLTLLFFQREASAKKHIQKEE